MIKLLKNMNRGVLIYYCIIALTALGLGLSNDVISNYFKDAYNVTAYQRGLIEFPRELPGILFLLVIAGLSSLSDIRISMLSQVLSIIGITVLGLLTPSFALMLVFVFINSIGMHLFFPLQDSIGISLIKDGKIGKGMGQYKGVSTAFTMLASIIVFIGFRVGFFSFITPTKWIFIISAAFLVVVLILFFILERVNQQPIKSSKKIKFVFRKKYKYYYALVIMFGMQKQMMTVYGPWVLIDLLGKKADTLAVLGIIGSFAGIFFIPALGRWLDRFGVKKLLYADALSFIGVYFLYGLLSGGFVTNTLAKAGLPVILAYILVIIDRMSMQMGIVRTTYLRAIVVDDSDIMPTLSLGQSMDHTISITCAYLGGVVWTLWGAQYVFFMVSALSFVNLYVAIKVKLNDTHTEQEHILADQLAK